MIGKEMQPEQVKDIVDDRLSQRFESYAQTQDALHKDYHDRLLLAVKEEIKVTVNGKIDKIQTTLDKQDKILESLNDRLKPFEDGVSWFTRAKSGVGWLAGFMTSISLIGASVMFIIKWIRQ